ncbi:DNA-processing protein DprA [Nocardioides sp. URHA0020]|uniref:DNA-processing protein DprA n=1 Tax=Nocardioides sp. URHA0020 TaxID=1380392 RepID=UPI00056638AF|nr:DNA-processing protein DprA [Nocardioides sp. URHA0020]
MTASDADRLARVALTRIAEPGHVGLLGLVAATGAEAALAELSADPVLGPRLDAVDPERELAAAARRGLRFVVPGDDEWPPALDDLQTAEPVQERGGVPLGLWVRGPLRLDQLAGSLAVVGARTATTYGSDLAADLAATVGQAGRAIVSGAAFGIDFAAHRGAIAVGAPTVAVLACGADRVYPQAHQQLIDHLAAEGAVVSETAPGGAPMRVRFLSRNRIIAALSGGTVVVEAALRSGALNTANWAGRLNRPVMGVPGPVTSASSAGVHQLIRTGAATLVTSGEDVLELLGAAGEHVLDIPRGKDRPRDALSHLQRRVLDAVPVSRGAPSTSVAHVAGLAAEEVHATLLALEARGMVEVDDDGWRLAALAHD